MLMAKMPIFSFSTNSQLKGNKDQGQIQIAMHCARCDPDCSFSGKTESDRPLDPTIQPATTQLENFNFIQILMFC